MKKIISFIILIITFFVLSSCSIQQSYDIVTTLFPQYDLTKAIVGDTLSVKNILPFGSSPHGYELTSRDRQTIENASLFIYTSDDLEVWAKGLSLSTTYKLNLEHEVDAYVHDEDDEHHEEHEDHDDHDDHDVHYWTHPDTFLKMVDIVLDHLIEMYPNLEETFVLNKTLYVDTFNTLVLDLKTFLIPYENDDMTLYIAGHNAMAEFGEYFNFHIVSLFPNFIPDAELTSSNLTLFIEAIRDNNIQAFFIEPFYDTLPLAANTIKTTLENEDYPVSFFVLDGFHNISKTDYDRNITLFDMFEQNSTHIKIVIELNYGRH